MAKNNIAAARKRLSEINKVREENKALKDKVAALEEENQLFRERIADLETELNPPEQSQGE